MDPTSQLSNGIVLRALGLSDGPRVSDYFSRNRAFLRPYEPLRDEDFFTEKGTNTRLAIRVRAQDSLPSSWILLDGATMVGQVSLSNIARGPFQSATIGYSIDHRLNGQGLATAAVKKVVDLAFTTLGLHRIEAGTLLDNIASQRVLEKNSFRRIGVSHFHLQIAGEWQHHMLYSVTRELLESTHSS